MLVLSMVIGLLPLMHSQGMLPRKVLLGKTFRATGPSRHSPVACIDNKHMFVRMPPRADDSIIPA